MEVLLTQRHQAMSSSLFNGMAMGLRLMLMHLISHAARARVAYVPICSQAPRADPTSPVAAVNRR
eukprot:scaffold27034_cov126-Skeletonema_dohrnii-CCMP3373.AAC.2